MGKTSDAFYLAGVVVSHSRDGADASAGVRHAPSSVWEMIAPARFEVSKASPLVS